MTHSSSELVFRSDFDVELLDHLGNDLTICQSARVSSGSATNSELGKSEKGLLRMLMRDRHGTPFESVVFRFRISASIVVARESHRHRIASLNEESGRYKELEPVFYMPSEERPLQQIGKPGAYSFEPGTVEQYAKVVFSRKRVAEVAWQEYQEQLAMGIAREVARDVLPLNTFTSWYLTINLRSLFNYLSLRNKTDDTTVPTFPQWEIQEVARLMEALAWEVVPESMSLFNELGRVSP